MSQPIFTMTGYEVFVNKETNAKISIHVEVKGRHLDELWGRAYKLAERKIRAVFGDSSLDHGTIEAEGEGVDGQEFYTSEWDLIERHDQTAFTDEQRAAAVARRAYLPDGEVEAERLYGESVAAPAAKLLTRLRREQPGLDQQCNGIWTEVTAIADALEVAVKKYYKKDVLAQSGTFEQREAKMKLVKNLRDEIAIGQTALKRVRELIF